jgi:fluoride exporter
MIWIAVAAGGALGSMARHLVNVTTTHVVGQAVPYASAIVNIVGCTIIGLLAGGIAGGAMRMSTPTRTFIFVGILGGFTTFSSFGLDTFTLVRDGNQLGAFANVLIQVGAGLIAVFAGYAIGVGLPRAL